MFGFLHPFNDLLQSAAYAVSNTRQYRPSHAGGRKGRKRKNGARERKEGKEEGEGGEEGGTRVDDVEVGWEWLCGLCGSG